MTNEELMKKLKVGFHSKEDKRTACPYLRLECLKIAFDVASKVGAFDQYNWVKKSEDEQLEVYEQVYELAEMNYKFMMKERE